MGLKHLQSCESWFLCSFVCQFIHLYHVLSFQFNSFTHPLINQTWSNSWCQIWLKCCQRWVTNQMFKSSLSKASSTPTPSLKSNVSLKGKPMTGQMIAWGQKFKNYILQHVTPKRASSFWTTGAAAANKPFKTRPLFCPPKKHGETSRSMSQQGRDKSSSPPRGL